MDFLAGVVTDFVSSLAMDLVEVVCPTCFESFEVVMPPPEELPTEVDYDCEICCRPMQIAFDGQGAWARGLAD